MSTMLKPKEHVHSFGEMFDLDRFVANPFFRDVLGKAFPAVNIRENENSFVIDFAAPGFSKEDFKIKVTGDTLTVSAQKQEEKKEEKDSYTRREFSYNSFSRAFTLPESADHEQTEAVYENGILKLTVKKRTDRKEENNKTIAVK